MKLSILFILIIIGLLQIPKSVPSEMPKLFEGDPLVIENRAHDVMNLISELDLTALSGDPNSLLVETTVQFFLYTQSNMQEPHILKVGDVNDLNKSPFNPACETKIIIHGWSDSVMNPLSQCISQNYLKKKNYNVIIVNWAVIAKSELAIAVKLARPVGEYIGKMVNFMNIYGGLSLPDVHMIGASLGAHIAGFAGAFTFGLIGRITGLDTARPLFEVPYLNGPEDRLDETDALFVDIIHTCGGVAGFIQAIGHADFYPNGGIMTQPGCPSAIPVSCSHTWAVVLMLNSIKNPGGFDAVECDSWENYNEGNCSGNSITKMGEYVNQNSRGKYYLKTSPSVDFC